MKNLRKGLTRVLRRAGDRRGFTLVETLVSVLLFVVIFGACFAIFMSGTDTWQVSDVRIALQQELRKAMQGIKEDLMQAGVSQITNVPANGNPYTTITFRKPAGVTAGSIDWNTYTTQFLLGGADANQLQRLEGADTKIIAQDIKTLQFTRQVAAPDIVEVTLEAEKSSIKGHTLNESLNFKMKLRN